jgi:hypothetical protein
LCEPVYRRSARRVAEPMQQFGGAQGGGRLHRAARGGTV